MDSGIDHLRVMDFGERIEILIRIELMDILMEINIKVSCM